MKVLAIDTTSERESVALAAILPSPRKYNIRGEYVESRIAELLPRMAVPAPRP